jgi:hypothetical protein
MGAPWDKGFLTSVLLGFAAMPTREPISEQEARSARSTISSSEVLTIMILLPSPESIAQGTSSQGLCTASVVCQYLPYSQQDVSG